MAGCHSWPPAKLTAKKSAFRFRCQSLERAKLASSFRSVGFRLCAWISILHHPGPRPRTWSADSRISSEFPAARIRCELSDPAAARAHLERDLLHRLNVFTPVA